MTRHEVTTKFFDNVYHRTNVKQPDGTYAPTGPEYISRHTHWEAFIDGKTYQGLSGASETKVRDAAFRAINRWNLDEALMPLLLRWYGQPTEAEYSALLPLDRAPMDLKYGDEVVVYSRGAARKAVVFKIGRKNVEIAYVTDGGVQHALKYGRPASNAQITHKTVKLSEVLVP